MWVVQLGAVWEGSWSEEALPLGVREPVLEQVQTLEDELVVLQSAEGREAQLEPLLVGEFQREEM
jgi:hypothetical protein